MRSVLTSVAAVALMAVVGVVVVQGLLPALMGNAAPRPALPTASSLTRQLQAQGYKLDGELGVDGYDIVASDSGAGAAAVRVDIRVGTAFLNPNGVAAARAALASYPSQVLTDFDAAVPSIQELGGSQWPVPDGLSLKTRDYTWGEMVLNLEGSTLRITVSPR